MPNSMNRIRHKENQTDMDRDGAECCNIRNEWVLKRWRIWVYFASLFLRSIYSCEDRQTTHKNTFNTVTHCFVSKVRIVCDMFLLASLFVNFEQTYECSLIAYWLTVWYATRFVFIVVVFSSDLVYNWISLCYFK